MTIKIGDFGLALHKWSDKKDESKIYNAPVPYRWVALESLRFNEFNVQSDAWSYGIVLWELFSLGKEPYAFLETIVDVHNWLIDGNRLEPPEHAPKPIYDLMVRCWNVIAIDRPKFPECRTLIGNYLHIHSEQAFRNLQELLLENFHADENVLPCIDRDDSSTSPLLTNSERAFENINYNAIL